MARDPNRIRNILNELEAFWRQNPDLRLGQIISNMTYLRDPALDAFYIEDEHLLHQLKKANSDDKEI